MDQQLARIVSLALARTVHETRTTRGADAVVEDVAGALRDVGSERWPTITAATRTLWIYETVDLVRPSDVASFTDTLTVASSQLSTTAVSGSLRELLAALFTFVKTKLNASLRSLADCAEDSAAAERLRQQTHHATEHTSTIVGGVLAGDRISIMNSISSLRAL